MRMHRSSLIWGGAIVFSLLLIAFSLFFLYLGQSGPIRPEEDLISDFPESVFYEIYVPSFYDSDGDGIGDINGVRLKLDDLKALGVEALWLMPIYPSPSPHGYDITDYTSVRPEYGTVEDVKRLADEAHARGMHLILDFVANHTSIEHPWFQKALAGDPYYHDFYIWANDQTPLSERGEWGQKLWHPAPVTKQGLLSEDKKSVGVPYYMATFDSSMPDLNYDNPHVRKSILDAAIFWLKVADVDGFRLDAAKHLYPKTRLDDTVRWWITFRHALETVKPNVFLVGEVWDTPGVNAPFYQAFSSTFDFDLAERLLKVVQTETEGGLVSYLSRVRTAYAKVNPHFIDAIFLSNHDTPRVMTALDGDMHHAKMAASLLLTLPGAPFLYYGEEIGMFGPKPDPRIREPIRWGGEEDAHSPTSLPRLANRDGPVYHEVERDPMGLYRHYRTMIYLRRSLPALVYGDIAEAHVRAHGLVAFYRRDKEEHLLVLHNVGQAALDLSLEGEHRSFTLVYGTHVDNHLSSDGRMVHLAPYSTTILRERP